MTLIRYSQGGKTRIIICMETRLIKFLFLNILNLLCFKKELEIVFVTRDDFPFKCAKILDVKNSECYHLYFQNKITRFE